MKKVLLNSVWVELLKCIFYLIVSTVIITYPFYIIVNGVLSVYMYLWNTVIVDNHRN